MIAPCWQNNYYLGIPATCMYITNIKCKVLIGCMYMFVTDQGLSKITFSGNLLGTSARSSVQFAWLAA